MKLPTRPTIVRTKRPLLSALVLSLSALFAAPNAALAIPLTWSVNGTFADGGTLAGSLTYDATTNSMSAWSLTVAGGNVGTFAGFTYSSSIASSFIDFEGTDDHFIFCSTAGCNNPVGGGQRRDLRLGFASALSDAGGSIALLPGVNGPNPGYGFECFNCSPVRLLAQGSASTRVPEPATLTLFSLALVGLAQSRWRRTRRIRR